MGVVKVGGDGRGGVKYSMRDVGVGAECDGALCVGELRAEVERRRR